MLEKMWTTEHSQIASVFLLNPSAHVLFAYLEDNDNVLRLFLKPSQVTVQMKKVLYFLRNFADPVNDDNINDIVSGLLVDSPLDTLLHIMKSKFAPILLKEKLQWPDSLQKDFVSQLHKFLASLTETTYRNKGSTVLYVPLETIDDIEEAQKQKDLFSQLENSLMQWISQIKEVVHDKDSTENIENARPLSEIEYWKSRAQDLMNIKKQIQREEVQKIVKVLSGSTYLKTFKDLSEDIQNGADEALDNHKFLLTLKEPCERLARADPMHIPQIIPEILHLIHKIHDMYLKDTGKTQERLTQLLREVSNEIIFRCSSYIQVEDMWNGNVFKCIKSLNESIYAGESWKRMCTKQEEFYKFDKSNVFGEIKAFIQRCNELLEMCEAQIQFGSRVGMDETCPNGNGLPTFPGTTGPEITKSLLEIQNSFQKHIHDIQNLNYPILDVKSTSWHDDYKKFKNGIRDLELILQQVISSAFQTVTDIENSIQLLEAFHYLSKRENIKTTIETKSGEICAEFQKQLENIENEFQMYRKSPPIPTHHPKYAGAALWAYNIVERIEHDMNILNQAHFIPETREHNDMKVKYDSVKGQLEKFLDKTYSDWSISISDLNFSTVLDIPLMTRVDGLLQVNFDKNLQILFEEIKYWKKLSHYDIPDGALELYNSDKDKLRMYRENVATVVRSYNEIIQSLSPEEQALFKQKIQQLDNEMKKGLVKTLGVKSYTWSSRGEIDLFVKSCRKVCDDLKAIVTDFKQGVTDVYLNCRTIADTLFIKIESKRIYNEKEGEFEKVQQEHRELATRQLTEANNRILDILRRLYQYFENEEDVQSEWWKFIQCVEKHIDQALRTAVKRSLQKLAGAIKGDKSEQNKLASNSPLFSVDVILKKDDPSEVAPDLDPSVSKLVDIVDEIIRHLIRVSGCIPRLEQALREWIESQKVLKNDDEDSDDEEDRDSDSESEHNMKHSRKDPSNYFDGNVSEDKDIRQLIKVIIEGMDKITADVEHYKQQWSKDFKDIWIHNKDKFFSRFGAQNRNAEGFETEILKYKDFQHKIQHVEPTKIVSYIQLDSAPLKHTLIMECNLWQNRLLDLCHSIAQKDLNKQYETFEKNTELLKEDPTNLDQLEEKIRLVSRLAQEHPKNEQLFQPISEKYDMLKKYDVGVGESEIERRLNLKDAGDQFKKTIEDAQASLENDKDKFRIKLKASVDVFTQNVTNLKSDFTTKGPYAATFSVKQALNLLRDFKNKITLMRKEETKLRSGMKIFNLEMQQYKELKDVSKDIESLEKMWTLQSDWNEHSKKWKQTTFLDLNVEDIQSEIIKFNERLNSMGKEVREWGVWSNLKEDLDKFKRILPLLIDLKSPAIRDRHWEELSDIMNSKLDPKDATFNLKIMMEKGFENYVEDISNMSNSATQELNIERDLEKIRGTWQVMQFDIVDYKQVYFKLKSAEDIFLALDDNMATLGSMKISQYVGSFQSEVNEWERNLARISESVEMLLQVQKQWIYLFNIFDVEDIQKDLPTETGVFKVVNNRWKSLMSGIYETKNAYRATMREGVLTTLNDMNSKLEHIQKQLDQYLAKKRDYFPRFYFLSDNDLLEILGQARDPTAVQSHLKNLFEAIRRLKIEPSNDNRQGGYLAHGMYSAEGEYIEFNHPVLLEGQVEYWLLQIEGAMRQAIKKSLTKCCLALRSLSKDKDTSSRDTWIGSWAGQLLITSSQIYWTMRLSETLSHEKEGKKGNKEQKDVSKIPRALQLRKEEWNLYLESYSTLIRENLSALEREKLISLITMEVHARDTIDKLIKKKCYSLDDFDWLEQLRFYLDEEQDDRVVVRQTSAEIDYDYEYIGNSGRLVITPLTERCYVTLTTALQLRRGGNPQGPAGTGKTETVKDLGKSIAKYVIVFNCSDSVDYRSLGRLFSGIVQTGAWSCLDEFNRIELDVLSVVAQQISRILTAISTPDLESFIFEGSEAKVNRSCGIFVTMNPGYAGRSELPDNLKALLRPVAMMKPDSALICQIRLRAQGFKEADELSRKITALYSLMEQQLSRQKHYDFGLRNITSVLDAAGALKRQQPDAQEHILLLTACIDMNEPKFIAEDIPLFNAIINDLFPGVESPEKEFGQLQSAIVSELKSNDLQDTKAIIDKILYLYDTKKTRHGVMVVGRSGSGKSTAWKTLKNSMTRLKQAGVAGFNVVHDYIINPKAVSTDELYGNYSKGRDWRNGVFSVIMKETCEDTKPDEKWLVFDGPVDTLWIESMNTLLDDNKILTLINGTRISLSPQVSLLFEVQDLDMASPATVSRCGMIFFDESTLGWQPIIKTWLIKRELYEKSIHNPQWDNVMKYLRSMCDKFVQKALDVCKEQTCIVDTTDVNAVQSFCNLYDSIATVENGLDHNDKELYLETVQKFFVFSLVWSIGATVDLEGRRKMDILFREVDPQFPSKGTAYEYYIDTKSKTWKSWDEKVNQSWKPAPNTPFYKILVPTVDTVRNSFIMNALIKAKKHVLVVGLVGTGKTAMTNYVLSQLDQSEYTTSTINFSARTESEALQNIIESRVEKKPFDILAPFGGKQLVLFLDQFNMPKKDEYGSQPPLELLRQWIEYGFWYDRSKQTKKVLKKTQLIAAMGPPGGGRTVISERLQSHFNILNVTFPSDNQTKRIYGTLLKHRLEGMEEIKSLGDTAVQATLELYKAVTTRFLPTPSKSHYVFNLRDLSKVFQGIINADLESMDNRDQFIRLWLHENNRVFYDRLNTEQDKELFRDLLNEKSFDSFAVKISQLNNNNPLFGDILQSGSYVEMSDIDELKREIEFKLKDYNETLGNKTMDLVMFNYALEHLCRIHRILKQPRGNALLVGVGGSGRQSLTRLAAYIAGFKVKTIEIFKNYSQKNFHDDLKDLYMRAGVKKEQLVFLFSDTQIIEEGFLEDVNNMLSSGEVPNLFDNDEMNQIYEGVRKEAISAGKNDVPEEIYSHFIEIARQNIHIVVCMSPVSHEFRNRIRMFPGLVNNTTIDWFSEWPATALKEVALAFLEKEPQLALDNESKTSISDIFVTVHESVVEASAKVLLERKRQNYVTPTNYLELITGFVNLMKEKKRDVSGSIEKLEKGLTTLENARVEVERMSVELEKQKKFAAQSKQECENLMMIVLSEKSQADDKKQQVELDRSTIEREKMNANKLKETAEDELKEALPDLLKAEEALNTLQPADIHEIKQYTNPPPLVKNVLTVVMVVLKKKPDFATAKQLMANPAKFIQSLIEFKKNDVNEQLRTKIEKEIKKQGLDPAAVKTVSTAAYGMCLWVIAISNYTRVYKGVKPLEDRLKKAEEDLAKSMQRLAEAEKAYQDISEKVASLSAKYEQKTAEKEHYRKQAEETEMKLNRATELVGRLSGERERWTNSIADFKVDLANIVGDNLIAAAFLSYAGPFSTVYRQALIEEVWMKTIKKYKIPSSANFSVQSFLAKATELRSWVMQGLPSDSFSAENAVLVTRGKRWPLMIDPQGQANKWVKNLEKDRKLLIIDAKDEDLLRKLTNAIKFGYPVLIQDVLEEIDPSLEPILGRNVTKRGNREVIKLGDQEIQLDKGFKLYMTTKMYNPHYQPEISTKTTIVNFNVTKEGLEDQLLGIVVTTERRELEEQKNDIVVKVATAKKRMEELEDEILKLLTTTTGTQLLDDETVINTLNQSKQISEEIKTQLVISQETEKKIDIARNQYRNAASRASVLYFVLCDLSVIDPMYQFALKTYLEVFEQSINNSKRPQKSDQIKQRVDMLNEYHTLEVYRTTCQGLFEKHKLLFAFQICIKIMEDSGSLNMDEYNFLLKGGIVIGPRAPNPLSKWLPDKAWDNITELDKLPNFHGIANSFEEESDEWKAWYKNQCPELEQLPSEWQSKVNDWSKMLIVRCVREDRILFMIKTFITDRMNSDKFIKPPVNEISQILTGSLATTPLIFILSPGVDPQKQLERFAKSKNINLMPLALGKDQEDKAEQTIRAAKQSGDWVFLANCHLMIKWMPALDEIIEKFNEDPPHPSFRLWLSSKPHDKFPITLLQRSRKITTEPPQGLQSNLERLYKSFVSDEHFKEVDDAIQPTYKKLLFSLSFFHSILLERTKFGTLGWNIPYDFNDSDFAISDNILQLYLTKYEKIPWEALTYLIAEISYGGRVTDDMDRRILDVYVKQYFNQLTIDTPDYPLSSDPMYHIPQVGNYTSYMEFIQNLKPEDPPAAFGQHANADISSQINNSTHFLGTLLSITPQTVSANKANTVSAEDKVFATAKEILENRIPELIDVSMAKKQDESALNTVLIQEIQRYNHLLSIVKNSLANLLKGIKGEVLMDEELEEVFQAMNDNRVPALWQIAYPSLKPLASWIRDLKQRVDQFRTWADGGQPVVFWLPGFTFASGFLTAVKQMTARSHRYAVDELAFEFNVMPPGVTQHQKPKEGVYVKGLILEGAKWDSSNGCLTEPDPMELTAEMPIILFKPVHISQLSTTKKKASKEIYSCPLYSFPIRCGTQQHPSFISTINLKSGNSPPAHWIRRGTALLLSDNR
jgi:dynein heavy chain